MLRPSSAFRSQVWDCAYIFRRGQFPSCTPKINNEGTWGIKLLDGKICRFYVSMHDAFTMKKGNALKYLPEELNAIPVFDQGSEQGTKGTLREGKEEVYSFGRVTRAIC